MVFEGNQAVRSRTGVRRRARSSVACRERLEGERAGPGRAAGRQRGLVRLRRALLRGDSGVEAASGDGSRVCWVLIQRRQGHPSYPHKPRSKEQTDSRNTTLHWVTRKLVTRKAASAPRCRVRTQAAWSCPENAWATRPCTLSSASQWLGFRMLTRVSDFTRV